MTRYIFRYRQESVGQRVIHRPKIPVFLYSANNEWHAFQVYVDSGADISLFTRTDAEFIGLNLTKGEYHPIIGVGRVLVPAYLHTVKMRIGDFQLDIKAAFADSDETPRLLGRTGVFPHFRIIFAEQDLKIIFETIEHYKNITNSEKLPKTPFKD